MDSYKEEEIFRVLSTSAKLVAVRKGLGKFEFLATFHFRYTNRWSPFCLRNLDMSDGCTDHGSKDNTEFGVFCVR